MSTELTLAELRELELVFKSDRSHHLYPGEISYVLRAVRELIALREEKPLSSEQRE